MKRCISRLFFLLIVVFSMNCFADCICQDENAHFVACPKTYVTPDQIDFHENKIFVRINGVIIQTESLSTDTQGIFFSTSLSDGCGPSQWRCRKRLDRDMVCNTCNWDWNYRCSYCNRDK